MHVWTVSCPFRSCQQSHHCCAWRLHAGVLRPTPQVVEQILADPELAAGFEDPEVAAVSDRAGDPTKLREWAANPKVGGACGLCKGVLPQKSFSSNCGGSDCLFGCGRCLLCLGEALVGIARRH